MQDYAVNACSINCGVRRLVYRTVGVDNLLNNAFGSSRYIMSLTGQNHTQHRTPYGNGEGVWKGERSKAYCQRTL